MTDGVVQWSPTGSLVDERIGPRAIVVLEANLPLLVERLPKWALRFKV
jgi:hypothetical protein